MKQTFEKALSSLRAVADEISDPRLLVDAWATIASISHKREDLLKARGYALETPYRIMRPELLVVITKILSQEGHFEEARRTIREIGPNENYWRAEGYVWLARFSGDHSDINEAELAAEGINAPYLRNEVMIDIEILIRRKHHHTGVKAERHQEDVRSLRAVLARIKSFEDRHQAQLPMSSAYLRFKAEEITARVIAEEMRK